MRTVVVKEYRGRVETLAGWPVAGRAARTELHLVQHDGEPAQWVEVGEDDVLLVDYAAVAADGRVYAATWKDGHLWEGEAAGQTVLAILDTSKLGLPDAAPGARRCLTPLMGRPTRRPGLTPLGADGRPLAEVFEVDGARHTLRGGAWYERTACTMGAWDALLVHDDVAPEAFRGSSFGTLAEALGGEWAPPAPRDLGVLCYTGTNVEFVPAARWARWVEKNLPRARRGEALEFPLMGISG